MIKNPHRIWQEDDALPHDGESLHSAVKRLLKMDLADFRNAAEFTDMKDAFKYSATIEVISSYPGGSEIRIRFKEGAEKR